MKQERTIDSAIQARYSPRAYSNQKISQNDIDSLFEAARWAASSRNEQPWRFIYATPDDEKRWNMLYDCLIDFNREWVKTAPFLMMVLAQTKNPETGADRKHVAYDIGLAMGNLTYQAMTKGIYLRNMGGYSEEKARKIFGVPDNFTPIVMVAAGYPGDENKLDKQFAVPKGTERDRKSLDELIFDGNWDKMK